MSRLVAGLISFALSTVAAPVGAVDLENLVSPGALFEAHARKATECADCHKRFDREAQRDRCFVCHEEVARDVGSGRGFHGRIGDGSSLSCRTCHPDHRGADADILGLVPESFDHTRTDFELSGAHASTLCSACHEPDKPHRDAPGECSACHGGEEDPHGGRLGEACQDCHEPAGWKEIRFDHTATRFPLEGRHAEAACELCHPRQQFRETPTECVTCHRVDDVHRGRLGAKCGDCHDARSFEKSRFDHAKETQFALRERHATLECRQCHVSNAATEKLDRACIACHAADDDHHGNRGGDCGSCHDARSWKRTSFDHDRDTKFALRESHRDLACDLCHTSPLDAGKTPSRCASCHGLADVHEGSLGSDCGRCHRESRWRDTLPFDHDLTRFPILALHQVATCEDCHVSQRFGDAETTCAGCHRAADVHERTLGPACALCHSPNGWERWQFDHARQTDYPLTGAHENLQCRVCHVDPVQASATTARLGGYIDLSSRCRSCHLRESPHDDAFGRDCERCHTDTSWKEILRRSR